MEAGCPGECSSGLPRKTPLEEGVPQEEGDPASCLSLPASMGSQEGDNLLPPPLSGLLRSLGQLRLWGTRS